MPLLFRFKGILHTGLFYFKTNHRGATIFFLKCRGTFENKVTFPSTDFVADSLGCCSGCQYMLREDISGLRKHVCDTGSPVCS